MIEKVDNSSQGIGSAIINNKALCVLISGFLMLLMSNGIQVTSEKLSLSSSEEKIYPRTTYSIGVGLIVISIPWLFIAYQRDSREKDLERRIANLKNEITTEKLMILERNESIEASAKILEEIRAQESTDPKTSDKISFLLKSISNLNLPSSTSPEVISVYNFMNTKEKREEWIEGITYAQYEGFGLNETQFKKFKQNDVDSYIRLWAENMNRGLHVTPERSIDADKSDEKYAALKLSFTTFNLVESPAYRPILDRLLNTISLELREMCGADNEFIESFMTMSKRIL